ncbi:MAG: YHS domain-containing protein [Sedimentisphaerales bacterium]|nr:YHS domain-containing protein [Sedimentisphaerales bacterium]
MKKKGLMLLALTLLTTALVLVGCKKKEEPAPTPKAPTMEEMKETATKTAEDTKKTAETMAASVEQTMCPVMDGNKIDKNVFVEYKGKKVYFCCADCKAKFEADPEKYVANLPQFKK